MTILQKAKKAGKIQFAATLLSKGIGVVFTIVLARILFPEDYGNLTIAIIFTGFLTIFSNFGFQTYLVQEQTGSLRIVQTTFFLEMLFASIISLLLFFASYIIQVKLNNAVLGEMLRWYCINIMLVSVGHTPVALFKRNLDFNLSTRSDIAYTLSSNVGRVLFASGGFGALCFPLGDIVGNVIKLIVIFWYSDFRPQLKLFSSTQAKEILNFGGFTALTSIGSYLANQVDKVLVATYFTISQVGFYNFGYTQSGLYFNLVQVSQTSVLLSLFAKYRTNLIEARRVLMNITRLVNFLAMPVYGFAILEAELVIRALFSEKWLGALVFFQIFSADFLFRSFFTGITGIQLSFGLAKAAARTKIINSIIFVLLLLVATRFNTLEYYALFYLAATVLSTFHNVVVNGKLLQLNYVAYARNFLPNIGVIIVSLLLYQAIRSVLMNQVEGALLKLTMGVAIFGALYMIFSWVINRSVLQQVIRLIKPSNN